MDWVLLNPSLYLAIVLYKVLHEVLCEVLSDVMLSVETANAEKVE